jgi:hypothetical protein
MPSKALLTHNFFILLGTTNMETIEAKNTLLEQEAPRKPGRLPSIVMTSTTNLIQLRSDLKDHINGEYKF